MMTTGGSTKEEKTDTPRRIFPCFDGHFGYWMCAPGQQPGERMNEEKVLLKISPFNRYVRRKKRVNLEIVGKKRGEREERKRGKKWQSERRNEEI